MSRISFKSVAISLAVLLCITLTTSLAIVFTRKNSKTENYIQKGMVMQESAELRLKEPMGLRFVAKITPELRDEVRADKNKSFGMVLGPLSYWTMCDTKKTTDEVDWMKEFTKQGLKVVILEDMKLETNTTTEGKLVDYSCNGVVSNIPPAGSTNRLFGLGYVKTVDKDGNASYRYASVPKGHSYKDLATSYLYQASSDLNDVEINKIDRAPSELVILNKIVNDGVDVLNGVKVPTDDGSTFAVKLSATTKSIKVNEKFELGVTITEKTMVPIAWRSEDYSIATVENGVITGKKDGVVNIVAIVAGKLHTCEVTVGTPTVVEQPSDPEPAPADKTEVTPADTTNGGK